MMFAKTQPTITYPKFLALVASFQSFTSITGSAYTEVCIEGSILKFVRQASGKKWQMDLKGVHRAYLELPDFKTINFKSYVSRTHSPALGLLLATGLLIKTEVDAAL